MSGNSIRRVLQVHTRYRQPGGEDRVVEAEKTLLEGAGIEVTQVIFDNAELRESRSPVGDLRLAGSAIWSRAAERRVRSAIAAHHPQVMHVHNTFVAASPSVYRPPSKSGVRVVQTLHNYRFVCPKATVFRDGHPCTDCVGRSVPLPAIVHACVRGSRPQSAVVSATIAFHRYLDTFDRRIDAYIALSSFQRQLMEKGGIPADRLRVIPNFLEPDPGTDNGPREAFLYVGRLAEQKGIGPLLRAAANEPGILRVAGDGPMAPEVMEAARAGHIRYLGPIGQSSVIDELRRAVALVVPSVWFEAFPVVVLEAYATGTPVLASRIGSLAEIVEEGVTGVFARADDPGDLAERLRWGGHHADEMRGMGATARERYESQYRGPAHLAALLDAYQAPRSKAS
jgi:glycosyltransferase involved in cell wall biosynthesis